MANEPRTYREALFEALRWWRPQLDVGITEPGLLDAEVGRFRPHLVVCSRDRGAARDGALTWVKLYPEGKNVTEIFSAGGRATIVGFRFADFLSVVDGTAFLRESASREGA